MATTQTFGGGVHPREIGNGKNATQSQQIVNAAAPARVMIAMAQHAGAPAVCCVKVGQTVNMGQIIGEAQGFISAPVHASVSGKVVAITTCTVASGKSVPAVVIDNDFEDRWDESVKPCDNVDALSAADIASIAARCGIVGMGGAAFPTNVKLDTSKLEEKPDTLIVNGSECEPYLTSDHRIMVENAEQIVDGIALAMKASGVACAKVGIEDNKPDAIAAMREAASGKQNIEVVSLPARYPQGFEKTLIYSLTGRIVPNGKLPSAAKCVVMNVGTCAALSAAVRKGQPLIDRVVTVTGRVANPANFRVRIGAPLLDLIDQAGGLTEGVRKLVCGQSVVLVSRGIVQEIALRGSRYTLSDLMEQLRSKDVFELADVEYAILETNGELSVLLKGPQQTPTYQALHIPSPEARPPFMLVQDGEIHHEALSQAGYDETWLHKQLKKGGAACIDDVFFAFLGSDGILHIQRKHETGGEAVYIHTEKKGTEKEK